MPSPPEVEAFLHAFHARMKVFDVLFRDDREKNTIALAVLGITRDQRKQVLRELLATDYCEGPIQDWDGGPDLWVFGKALRGTDLYIKVTLGFTRTGDVVCISFHPAEHPLQFPLR
jgi:hypothetical protein